MGAVYDTWSLHIAFLRPAMFLIPAMLGGEVRFRLSQHPSMLLFIAVKPQKLDWQKYMSPELFFHKLFKNTTFRHLTGIGKT